MDRSVTSSISTLHVGGHMNKDPYNEYIDTPHGKFKYDPDFDCYYRYRDTSNPKIDWVAITTLVLLCVVTSVLVALGKVS
jgi:hypothetical protein